MVVGAIIAGATDLSYSVPGYIWVAICAISTAAYLLLIRKLSDKTGKPLSCGRVFLREDIQGKDSSCVSLMKFIAEKLLKPPI